jgi:hypothetical protein
MAESGDDWSDLPWNIFQKIKLPEDVFLDPENRTVYYRERWHFEPDVYYQRKKERALKLVSKAALALRQAWVRQGRKVPPKERLKIRSTVRRIERKDRWHKRRVETGEEYLEEQERKRVAREMRREERERKEGERKERERKERERERRERERKERERREMKSALEAEQKRRREETEEEESRKRRREEELEKELEAKRERMMERDRRDQEKERMQDEREQRREEEKKREREVKERERMVREQSIRRQAVSKVGVREREDDTLSIMGNISFRCSSVVQRTSGYVDRSGEQDERETGRIEREVEKKREREVKEQRLFWERMDRDREQNVSTETVQAKKERKQQIKDANRKRERQKFVDSLPQAEKERINAEKKAETEKEERIESELFRISTRGERFDEKYRYDEEEESEESVGNESEKSDEFEELDQFQDDGAGPSGLQQQQAVTGTVTVPVDSEDEWEDDPSAANVISTRLERSETKFSHLGKAGRRAARAREHELLEIGELSPKRPHKEETRSVQIVEPVENAELKEQFLQDVISNTFEFGGGSQRTDENGDRYSYRTIEQIVGSSGSNATPVLQFCRKHNELFKVSGEKVELVHPPKDVRFHNVVFKYYTQPEKMQDLLTKLSAEEKVFGFDCEFFSYNIYKKDIFDNYKRRVKDDIKSSKAKVTVDNVIGSNKKKVNAKGEPRLAVERGIRLVQIYSAARKKAYIFYLRRRIEHEDLIASGLGDFIQNGDLVKYVVGDGDIALLQNRHFLNCQGLVDLQKLSSAVIRDVIPIHTKLSIGSNTLAISCGLGRPKFQCIKEFTDPEDPDGRTLGWLFDKLDGHSSTEQSYRHDLLEYSAYDAYAALKIGEYLLKLDPTRCSWKIFVN